MDNEISLGAFKEDLMGLKMGDASKRDADGIGEKLKRCFDRERVDKFSDSSSDKLIGEFIDVSTFLDSKLDEVKVTFGET